jgi:hypothetical protein
MDPTNKKRRCCVIPPTTLVSIRPSDGHLFNMWSYHIGTRKLSTRKLSNCNTQFQPLHAKSNTLNGTSTCNGGGHGRPGAALFFCGVQNGPSQGKSPKPRLGEKYQPEMCVLIGRAVGPDFPLRDTGDANTNPVESFPESPLSQSTLPTNGSVPRRQGDRPRRPKPETTHSICWPFDGP